MMDADTWIILNVGGRRFGTTKGTLCRYPDSMLATMFSNRHTLKTDNSDAVYLNRDPNTFAIILNYLRNSILHITPGVSIESVFTELDYFCIPYKREEETHEFRCERIRSKFTENLKRMLKLYDVVAEFLVTDILPIVVCRNERVYISYSPSNFELVFFDSPFEDEVFHRMEDFPTEWVEMIKYISFPTSEYSEIEIPILHKAVEKLSENLLEEKLVVGATSGPERTYVFLDFGTKPRQESSIMACLDKH